MDTDLDVLFDQLNNSLFMGSLPTYRVRRRKPQNGEHGFINDAARIIWICSSPDVRQTLLHEMCHIGTVGHGRLFRAKLRRLAQRGETWAQAERVYYLRAELSMKAGGWIALWEFARDFKGGLSSIVSG